MIGITSRGDFKKTKHFLDKMLRGNIFSDLEAFGQLGVTALARETPINTGLTAHSWDYRIIRDRRRLGIEWFNTNSAAGTSVAILIQYGHGTGTGGFVQGRDYINPAMRPVFDKIAESIWKKVRE